MKNKLLTVVLTLLVCGIAGYAQEKTGINRGEKKGGDQPSETAQAIERLQLAAASAKYGREKMSADAMILAAKIIKETPVQALGASPKSEGGSGEAGKKDAKGEMTAESLLADARKFASGDKATLERIGAVEKMPTGGGSKGAVGGPRRGVSVVRASGIDSYTMAFRGGEEAVIAISGDGDTDLDLYVYDEYGNLVASDDDYSDDCVARFYPKWAGNFTVRIKNRGGIANRYAIGTN